MNNPWVFKFQSYQCSSATSVSDCPHEDVGSEEGKPGNEGSCLMVGGEGIVGKL